MKKDFYETLGVTKSATQADIKSAYRKMAMKYHPDKNKDSGAEEHFKEINEAYEVLGNTEKRGTYDQFGHAAFDPSHGGGGYTWSSGGHNPFGNAEFDFGGFSNPFDIFEQFFGGQQRRTQHQRLATYKIQISFLEAVHGVEKNINIDGHKKSIKIPAGVDNGQHIRFSDFILYIDILPDKAFKREGNDVYITKDLALKQAVNGDIIEVPTLDKPLKVRIQPGTQSNTLIRLKGKGIKDVNGYGHGDFYIRLNVVIPTHF